MKSIVLALGLLALSPPARETAPSHFESTNRRVADAAGSATRHEFTPGVFHLQFSARDEPVLTISPGDTIHTTTLDAGGTDDKDQHGAPAGSPVLPMAPRRFAVPVTSTINVQIGLPNGRSGGDSEPFNLARGRLADRHG